MYIRVFAKKPSHFEEKGPITYLIVLDHDPELKISSFFP
jgi:hypothetical protein